MREGGNNVLIDFFELLGTNPIVLGVCSLLGIIGFLLTVFVAIRTSKISKILKYNRVTEAFNKERLSFQKTFEGHRKSIIEDDIKTDKILKDILKNVEAYRVKFNDILPISERIKLFFFIRLLKKKADKVDFNSVCNYLATFSGRLSKKGDRKNG